MKNLLLALLLTLTAPLARAGLWTDDYPAALEQAKAENRFVLMNFSGSDWCGWCKRLDAEVFSKGAFKDYAKDNLICVLVDFPKGFDLKKRVQEQNDQLAKEFEVAGFPTIVLLDPSGTKLATTGYKAGGAESYVTHLESLIAPAREKFGKAKTAVPGPAAAVAPGAAAPAAFRTWTATSGSTIEAKLEQRAGNKLYLRTRENKLITIDSASLSADDQAFLGGSR